jgi:hypothetical protein
MHEVLLTDEILPFWRVTERGPRVGETNADAVIDLGVKIACEMDLATEGYKQVQEQMDVYRDIEIYNVWFAPTRTRLEGIRSFGTDLSLYSVCGSKVWFDGAGNEISPARLIQPRCA